MDTADRTGQWLATTPAWRRRDLHLDGTPQQDPSKWQRMAAAATAASSSPGKEEIHTTVRRNGAPADVRIYWTISHLPRVRLCRCSSAPSNTIYPSVWTSDLRGRLQLLRQGWPKSTAVKLSLVRPCGYTTDADPFPGLLPSRTKTISPTGITSPVDDVSPPTTAMMRHLRGPCHKPASDCLPEANVIMQTLRDKEEPAGFWTRY